MTLQPLYLKVLFITTTTLLMTACEPAEPPYDRTIIVKEKECEEVQFRCLPESRNSKHVTHTSNQPSPTRKGTTVDQAPYQLSEREEQQIAHRKQQRMYKEITQMLDIYFPNFWGDTPEETKMDWVLQVHNKLRDYEKEDPKYTPSLRQSLQYMVIICAIVGIDFDQQQGHAPLTAFLKDSSWPESTRLSGVIDYLLFTYLKRDFNLRGYHISKWVLRAALSSLPYPDRRVPSLKEAPNGQVHHEEHDRVQIYLDTVKNGGKQ